jgi:hypothetical protein
VAIGRSGANEEQAVDGWSVRPPERGPAGRAEWGQRMSWVSRSHEPDWYSFVPRATPRQLALFGFPPPGHSYWTEATLTGTAQRYPDLNMTPWRRALRDKA